MFPPRPLKCHMLSFKTVVGQLCKFHIIKDERLPSKTEGKTNFSRRLKHFDGLSRLTLTPPLLYDRSTPLSNSAQPYQYTHNNKTNSPLN